MTSVEAATAAFLKRADKEGLIDVAYTTVDTPIGPLGVAATEAGLVRVALHPGEEDFVEDLVDHISPRVIEHPKKLDAVRKELDQYFNGKRTTFSLQIDWQLSHGFRQIVLQTLFSQVHFGEVVSYGELDAVLRHCRHRYRPAIPSPHGVDDLAVRDRVQPAAQVVRVRERGIRP